MTIVITIVNEDSYQALVFLLYIQLYHMTNYETLYLR